MLFILSFACGVSKASGGSLTKARQAVTFYRDATWWRQDNRIARHTQSKFNERRTRSLPYIRSLAKLWHSRALAERRIAKKYEQPFAAIRYVFGRYAGEAWEVAKCEGGHPIPSVNAANGQFLGMFQMGRGERAKYGHSHTALGQSVAAFRYFVAGGRDWHQWQCQPSGGLAW
jgi:hypothetical protein